MSQIKTISMSQIKTISLRCDTCGGQLQYLSNNIYECSRCLGKKYIGNYSDDEMKLLDVGDFERRHNKLFEKAIESYEAVLRLNPNNLNALWGMFLSEFGIEYVKDIDGTFKPTFHRLSRESVQKNKFYLKAINLATDEERSKYINDAESIEKIRISAIAEADKNDDYHIFICYKKTIEDGGLTPEASWAQDYYNEFTALGYKVFFADKSIKAGAMYEPTIFNALSKTKFMIILCTKAEYLDFPWVINEWGRFLRRKKVEPEINFCVVQQGVEPYDLPINLREAQALDHSKAACFDELKKAIAKTFSDIEGLKHTLKIGTIDIKGGEVGKLASEIKVSQIEKVELGTYQIGNITLTDKEELKDVLVYISNGKFKPALEILNNVLLSNNPNNYEALFAKLLAQTESINEDAFWRNPNNLSEFDLISAMLKCSPESFAKNFIDKWIKLCIRDNTVAIYKKYLEHLAKYDVPRRKDLVDCAQKLAEQSCDETLISIVERCFDHNDKYRFVDFYYNIANSFLKQSELEENN